MRRARVLAVSTITALAVTVSPAAAAPADGHVRVDGIGYAIGESKTAYFLSGSARTASFDVINQYGSSVLRGRAGASLGGWNQRFTAVRPLDLTALDKPGRYRVRIAGVTSPEFRIGAAEEVFRPWIDKTVQFFQTQRDGADVIPGSFDRKPSHLADRQATVYETPEFDDQNRPTTVLKPVGGPVDVEGGWFDAGDFLKFTHATSYSLASLQYLQRDLKKPHAALNAEIDHGLKWLDKAWDATNKTLYIQVGIGPGNADLGFKGDHDVWRLPQDDDALNVRPGDEKYYVKHRPVFRISAPISPNLAGRVAASFALAAQYNARQNPALAKKYLDEGASILAGAQTENVDPDKLVTALPRAFYPENSWMDDMELGAAELAAAGRALKDPRAGEWGRAATQWAKRYIASGETDTLNLYNTSALAHASLTRLLRDGPVSGAEVTERDLTGHLKKQLQSGVDSAAKSPFRTAASVVSFDAAPRSFGFASTAQLYRSLTGDRAFDAFGTQQRGFALGSNAWGVSLVIGAGDFSRCVHHQVANLQGDLNGGKKVLVGAVINGPNKAGLLGDLGEFGDMRPCQRDMKAFDGSGSEFLDDTRSWATSETAIDFTSTAMLTFGLTSMR
ncbi:glycoside hydrolase family 9 protein [Allokutzneria albata]|uniref:N-terminal ig-like domain of cellulase n=1 Tax=Allokutzneria albata TaxID=211114 RepID=A0A1G9XL33_ALLAB|nr:glycoside hydrolase family 9 protein [Allokutzneria albata]SDM97126.1 N-terminal ig-like domain of cellulase [Allokutzneria albata]